MAAPFIDDADPTQPNTPALRRLAASAKALTELAEQLRLEIEELKKTPPKLTDFVVYFHHLDTGYDALDKARKSVLKMQDWMDKALVPERLDAEGQGDGVRVPVLSRNYYPLTKYSASVIAEKRTEAYEWVRARDPALIVETINAGTLASYFKGLVIEENIEPPSDLFKFSSYKTMSSSKYTPK